MTSSATLPHVPEHSTSYSTDVCSAVFTVARKYNLNVLKMTMDNGDAHIRAGILVSCERGLSLNLEFTLSVSLSGKSQWHPTSTSPTLDYRCVLPHTANAVYWGRNSTCLHGPAPCFLIQKIVVMSSCDITCKSLSMAHNAVGSHV